MRLRVRPLLLAAIIELAALGWVAYGTAVPDVTPGMAQVYEGQGNVKIAGLAANIRAGPDGTTNLELRANGSGVAVRVAGLVAASEGTWLVAEGRVGRYAGRLTLWVNSENDVQVEGGPEPEQPSWTQLAEDPASWHDRRLRIAGIVERGAILDKEGHRLELGDGPWPKNGAVWAIGFLEYHPSCLCERFTASEVHLVGAS